jgi:hypothetical protein
MFYLLYVLEHALQPGPYDVRLYQVACGFTSSYDALLELFERLGNFLKRLEIYTTIPPTTIMMDIIVKIMVEVLSVLALATKEIKQGRLSECTITYTLPVPQCAVEKFAKKLFGKSEVEAVLQKLDRLTESEAQMTVTQTLHVAHGLVGNVSVVMEGTQLLHGMSLIFLSSCCIRWQGVNTFVIFFFLSFVERMTIPCRLPATKRRPTLAFSS